MLEELIIHDFALIERVQVSFKKGFNVLSGETGAGKSILIGAIGFLLGGKADAGVIRSGSEETLVSGVLSLLGNSDALEWLKSHDIPCEDDGVIIRRNMKATGRGSQYINNIPVTRPDLSEFSSLIVDLHGQHEHESLLLVENHRKLLDRYALLEGDVALYLKDFIDLGTKKKTFEKMLSSEKEREREIELLEHAVTEIENAKLKSDEEEILKKEELMLSQYEKLHSHLETANTLLSDSQGCLSALRKVRSAMEMAQGIDSALSDFAHRLEDAYYEIEDVAESISHSVSAMAFSQERLDEIEERLSLIRKLTKKYGATIPLVLEYAENSKKELESLIHWSEDREALETEIKEKEQALYAKAQNLSRKRALAAEEIKAEVERVIRTLGMPKAEFRTNLGRKDIVDGKPIVGQYGFDVVEFVLSPNPGEGEKPLAKIASGGELSRIMLAIKTALAKSDAVETMIFDEIDTGIGGEVALSVAEHLYALARKKQVFCITHLAVIAARADNHITVRKDIQAGRTLTSLENVSDEKRVDEIARMLSGTSGGEASRMHARELLKWQAFTLEREGK